MNSEIFFEVFFGDENTRKRTGDTNDTNVQTTRPQATALDCGGSVHPDGGLGDGEGGGQLTTGFGFTTHISKKKPDKGLFHRPPPPLEIWQPPAAKQAGDSLPKSERPG